MKRFLALLLPLLLVASAALGADRIGSWTAVQQSTDPFSQTGITTATDATLLVVPVCLYDTGAPAFDAITYGGNALTLATRVTVDTGEQTGIYYLVNPPAGSQTLVINHAGAIDEGMHAFYGFFQNVDTAGTPVDSLGSAVSGANDATINTPTAGTINTGDIAVGVGCVFGSDGVTLTGEVLDDTVFNGNDGAVGEITGTGAAVFTVTSGDFPAVSGIIIRNAAGGGTPCPVCVIRRHYSMMKRR